MSTELRRYDIEISIFIAFSLWCFFAFRNSLLYRMFQAFFFLFKNELCTGQGFFYLVITLVFNITICSVVWFISFCISGCWGQIIHLIGIVKQASLVWLFWLFWIILILLLFITSMLQHAVLVLSTLKILRLSCGWDSIVKILWLPVILFASITILRRWIFFFANKFTNRIFCCNYIYIKQASDAVLEIHGKLASRYNTLILVRL